MSAFIPFLESEYPMARRESAAFHVIPVPLEKSVSYGTGTGRGPAAILAASQQLEAWEASVFPGEYGIYTAPFVDCSRDIGTVLADIGRLVDEAVSLHACPVLLGGEHTVTLGALRSLAGHGRRPGLVQIDAHADLRESYEGSPYSHACVMYRACADLGYRLAQFGIREYSPEEVTAQRTFSVQAYTGSMLLRDGIPDPVLPAGFPDEIYVTFDVDGLDCSLMPATGTPSPGGLFWKETEILLSRLAESRKIVGFDVVELAPVSFLHCCDFTAAKLVYRLMALCCMQGCKGSVS